MANLGMKACNYSADPFLARQMSSSMGPGNSGHSCCISSVCCWWYWWWNCTCSCMYACMHASRCGPRLNDIVWCLNWGAYAVLISEITTRPSLVVLTFENPLELRGMFVCLPYSVMYIILKTWYCTVTLWRLQYSLRLFYDIVKELDRIKKTLSAAKFS